MQAESNVVGTDEEEPGFLVRITGFSTQTTEDALLNFFENTRRSGGGEIKEIQLSQDEGFTDIVFWHNEDARRVAQNDGLQLDGANLAATLKKIPKERPVDQRRLHVLGISDKTTKDGLISFMEVVSGEEVESISFGSHSNGMVCFKETIDFHEVQKMCKTNSLDENSLKVEEVKTCDCIEVTGFACNTTKDAILYYFKNKRKGGGDIKNFEEIESPERKMLVSFEDPKVVDNVMNQQDHVIDGAHLTVNRYYSFLGETSLTNPKGDRKKERIVSVDPKSMLFIEEFFGEELSQLLQECRVKYTWQEDSREIVLGCAEPKMDKTTWENSCDAVVSYINQIVTEKIYTTQEIWEQMRDKAKEKGVAFENEMQILYTFDFKKKNLSIQLRGKKTSVGVLAKQLQDFIAQIEKEILLEKSKITKKITLSEAQMDLLSFCGFFEDLKNGHQGLEVTMTNDSNEQAIQLRGQEDEVNEGNIAVWQALSNEKESEIELPKSIISILRSETGKVFIATNFKNNNVEAVVGFDTRSDTIIVTAVDRNNLKNAIDFIKEVTAEEGIPLDTEQKQLIGSNKWKELMHSIQDSMLLRATEDPESSMLLLAGIKQEVETAKEKVEEFFDENLISNKVIDAETGRVKFIFKFNLVAIKDIEDALKKYSVKLVKKSDERSGNVVVSGTRKGIEQAVPKAEMLINNVKDRIVAIDATILREIDQGKEWLEFLDGMENKYNCVIERLTEPRSMYDSLNVGPLGSELEKVDKLKLQVFAADTIVVQKIEDEINGFLEDNRKEPKFMEIIWHSRRRERNLEHLCKHNYQTVIKKGTQNQ